MTDQSRYDAYNAFVTHGTDYYGTIPHCDSRILHHPDDCRYCDRPEWQEARLAAGIAHTGRDPLPGQIPCEADADRPAGTVADHRRWGGNKPTISVGDPTWPYESFSSVVMYGDMGGREPWPLRERVAARIKKFFRRKK